MRQFTIPVLSRYGGVLLQFLIIAVVTHALDQDAAGEYFVVMGVIQATMYFGGFGLPDGVVRFAPALQAVGQAVEAASLLRKGLVASLGTIPIGGLLCAGGTYMYLHSWITATLAAFWWASYGVIFVVGQITVASGRASLGTAIFYSAANVGQMLTTVPVILWAHLTRLDSVLSAVVLGTSASAILSTLAALLSSGHSLDGKICSSRIPRKVWLQGGTMAFGRVVNGCINWLPVWIAGVVLTAQDAAVVGLASRLAAVVGALSAAVRFSMRHALARDAALSDWRAVERRVSRTAAFSGIFALSSIALVLAIGPTLISLVYGSTYQRAAVVTAIMLVGTLASSIPVDEVLRMSGQAHFVLVVQIGSLLVGIAAQSAAARLGGSTALVVTFSLGIVLMYVAMIVLHYHLRPGRSSST